MDRRTVAFIITLSLAFFGLQLIFSRSNPEKSSPSEKAQQVHVVEQELVSFQDLPVYPLSDDVIVTEDNGFFVALSKYDGYTWENNISITAQKKHTVQLLAAFEQFALYKKNTSDQQKYTHPYIPTTGSYDLQLVSFGNDYIETSHAKLQDGHVSLLKGSLNSLALAFISYDSRYAFIGYYDPNTATIQPLDNIPVLQAFVQKEKLGAPKEVAYFALQNEYQQLIFCTKGATVVEINLPFQSTQDKHSVVLPVDIDRQLVKENPQNAQFPLVQAKLPDGSFLKQQTSGFYPLLRRDLVNKQGVPLSHLTSKERAFNIVSEYPEVANLVYSLVSFTDRQIVFEAKQPHRKITKTYTLPENPNEAPYCFNLQVQINGDARGLSLTSGLLDVEWISGGPAPQIKYLLRRGDKQDVEQVELPKQAFHSTSIAPDWISNSNGFFGIIMDPTKGIESGFRIEKISGIQAPSRLTLIDASLDRYKAHDLPAYELFLPIRPQNTVIECRIFAGPFADDILQQVDAFYSKEQGGRNSDYAACQTFHGWFAFISEPFAKFLFFLMKLFHKLFGSWTLCIVLVTVVLRILLYPLNSWSLRSMKGMQIVAPKVRAIQEKYKKEPQKAQMEILALYKEHKVNPLSGCLPLLLQMPFLIGMFDLLKSTFELRGASFIPGWINDLAAPDVLFSWNYSIPWIGNEFHVLPIVLGGIMYLQQMSSANLPKDKSQWTDQQKQQKSMGNIMTVVMTVMFYQFPSGLNIYWISSMLLSIGQQWWTNRVTTKALSTPKKR